MSWRRTDDLAARELYAAAAVTRWAVTPRVSGRVHRMEASVRTVTRQGEHDTCERQHRDVLAGSQRSHEGESVATECELTGVLPACPRRGAASGGRVDSVSAGAGCSDRTAIPAVHLEVASDEQ
jgi:hypothetical protein